VACRTLASTEALLGPDWTGAPLVRGLLSYAEILIQIRVPWFTNAWREVRDAQLLLDSHKPHNTWLATHPFSRIDHFFVSPDIEVTSIAVPPRNWTGSLPIIFRSS